MAMSIDWQSGKTLAESINFMFEKGIDTDITFRFPNSDEYIKAHKLILKARSRVFFTMFHSGLENFGEDMEIPDIEPAIFREFVRYLYYDDAELSTTKALYLTYCAEKFDIKSLKAMCIEFLLQSVNEMTWLEILDHAVFLNEEPLIMACLHFFASQQSLGINGLEDYQITKKTLEVILDFNELSMKEIDIFKLCHTWAGHECDNMDIPINIENKRKMLGPLIKKIPFCSMKQSEFVAEVSGRDFLYGEEELEILRYLCAANKANPPFPISKSQKQQTQFTEIPVKLPNVWAFNEGGMYTFSIKCITQCFTLVGLIFTQPGTFLVSYGSFIESLEVHPECLTVYLKEAVLCEANTTLNIKDARFDCPHKLKTGHAFSRYFNSHNSDLYKKLDFVVTNHNKSSQPPFDTIIMRL